tara:strand:- start:79 stop:651 length:573 start_codon:yes stop_codon:yes gene_type:complete
MVRTTKSEKPATTATATEKKSRAKKETVATPAPAVAETVATEVATDGAVSAKLMTEFGNKIQQLTALLSTLKADYKLLEKSVARDMKNAQKSSGKKRKSSGTRQPSGFVKPTKISDELAAFLGKAVGSEMARTEVSKEINAYIKSKNLQDKENGREIHPDAALAKLLKFQKGDKLTYFNLQRYMKHHFPK